MPQAGLTNSARLSCSWLIVAASLLVICGWLMPAQAAIASEAGGVSGRVTAAASNEPLANIEVCAYEIAPPYAEACKTTAASGEYTLSELPEGRYSVSFASPVGSGLNYVEQTYAQPVTVASGATTPHIDAALAVGAEVTGTVRAEGSKAPIAGVEVCAYQVGEPEYEGFYATCGPTGASGEYTIAGLESGKYKLQFFAPAGSGLNYIAQYYAGKASWEEADAVQLTAGATKSAIDANMATGGEISGQASAAVGGAAIAGLEVCAVPITGGEDGCALTDASGDYTIPGLGTGSYRVEFSVTSQSTSSYLTQFFDDKPSYNEAEPVAVVVGSTTPDINAAMQPGATISGIVTGASKTPLRNVQACAYGDGAFRCATTNTAGEYAITALATGNYTVVFYGTSEYASQYYSGKVYSSEAQSVAATAGSTTPAIDAQLELGGTISGVVSAAATAAPLEDVSVCLFALHNGELRGCTYTNARGEYSLGGLASIEYKVSFSSSGNYLTQYFSAKSTLAEAEPVAVAPGETKSAINAALQAGAQISGIVTSAAGKQPVTGATVTAYTTTGGFVTSATTNVSGAYTLARLPTGTYKVGFSAPQQDLVSEYYEHTPSLGGAAELSVTAGGETTGIDATMQAGGEILGKVTDAATQAALSGVNVEVETTSGEFVTYAVSNADGEYEVSDLHEGSYKVDFHAQDYESQFYDGKIDLAEATTLAVGAGATVEKIDAAMQPLGSLSGEVTDASSHERLSDVEVCDYQQDSDLFGTCTSTNADGEYTFTGLSAGTYEVGFYPGSEYLEQFYNGQASLAEATKITLGQGATVSGISAALQTPGQIKGEVTSKASGLGLAGIEVCAEPVNDNLFGGCAATAADGTYDIADLVGGSYHIVFYPPEVGESSNYVLQFYNDEALKSEARAVSVTAGASTEGIDAALAGGGEIQGTIDSRASKTPIGAADACAYLPEGETYRCGYSNASGDYTIDGLPAGAYVVEFFSTEGEYVQQYYDGVATEAQATRVSVTPGAVTDSIDGTLPADGRIKGVVTSAASGDPLTAIEICLYSGEGVFERCTSTGVSGEYLLGGVSPGKHKVEFLSGSQAYETQYFNGKQSLSEADSVEVSEASTTEAVDAAMVLPGEITGRVTNEGGTTGIAGIQVCAEGVSNFSAGHCASTGANGEYALAALPRGTYRVSFYAPQGLNYIEQYYYDKGLYSEAETVTVTAGAATPNINAEMQVGGEITGQVDAGKPATGIAGIEVCPYNATNGSSSGCATTNSAGDYTIEKLATGEYRVEFTDPFNSTLNYIRQYYNGHPRLSEGQKLAVSAGATKGSIDATLQAGGQVSGKVTRIGNKAPLKEIFVCAYESEGAEVAPCVFTNANGEYTLGGLPAGVVDVEFRSLTSEYITAYYQQVSERDAATPVPVELLHDTTAINAALKSTHPIVPEIVSPPTITGTPLQGAALSEHHGSWTNEPSEYAYQWLSCNSLGLSCLPIKNADSQTYAPTAENVGGTVEVREIATNSEGESSPAYSLATAVIVAAVPMNEGAPGITGSPRVGQTLHETHGIWSNEPTSYTYQWERCSSEGNGCGFIGKATESSYIPATADVGHTLRVIETAINDGGESQPAVSEPSAVIIPEVPLNTGPPSITGTAQEGATLSEHHGSWSNEPTSYTYQWARCTATGSECTAIKEATGPSYSPIGADVGHKLIVEETAINAGGASKPAASPPSEKITAAVPVDISAPTISGEAVEGATLTERHGSWSNEPTSYVYQWELCAANGKECKAISGASEQTYTTIAADIDHRLIVSETAVNVAGPSKTAAVSLPTEAIVAAVPVEMQPPTISGTARQGETLSEHHGSWSNEPTSYEVEWQRCEASGENCVAVSHGEAYTLTQQDIGHKLRVIETARNAGGPGSPADSALTATVLAAVPANITPPSISGASVEGETLTEEHGSWTNEPSSYSYQWERCSVGGTECKPITDATGQSYVLGSGDVGHELVVVETAANAGGESLPQASALTAIVEPPVPVNVSPPGIEGSAHVEATLEEEHGSWSNHPTSYSYQWEQCAVLGEPCLAITGATDRTYVPTAEDLGFRLVVREIAINTSGSSLPARSLPTAPVTQAPPVDIQAPSVSGSTETGHVLAAVHGSWSGHPVAYSDEWLRCNAGGGNCQPIHDAINQQYVPTSADVGHSLEVQETASNSGGTSAPVDSLPTAAIETSPLHAVAGEDIETTVGAEATFDGSASTPTNEITGYHWEFGDETSAEGEAVTHTYSKAGTYTATLTVDRGGESNKQSLAVTVAEAPPQEPTVKVIDGEGKPVDGAEVLFMGSEGTRIEATSGTNGEAKLAELPNGSDTIYVLGHGYQPTTGEITVSEGLGHATVTLTAGEFAVSTLKSHEMSLQEIEAAGINPNEPGNSFDYNLEVSLPTGGGGGGGGGTLHCYINGDGKFVGNCSNAEITCTAEACEGDGWIAKPYMEEEHPLIEWLVLGGKATFVKQFFDISMIVQNLAPEPFKLSNGSATLSVPPGMSLAPTPTPQQATQSVPDIPGLGSSTTNWIVRGDAEGYYDLSASYHGELQPFDAPVALDAELSSPLHVWGASALEFRVQADSGSLTEGVPYHVGIGVTNVANIPLYNLALAINEKLHANFDYQPLQQFTAAASELAPGQTLRLPQDILVPDANSVGGFEAAAASVRLAGEEGHPGQHFEAVAPPPLYALSASIDSSALVHIHWQATPGAEGYEVFTTPSLTTAFGGEPEPVLASPSSTSPVTILPASATDAYVQVGKHEIPPFYAVSSLVGGKLVLDHPVKEPTIPGGPAGGALTVRELLAGGHNPSEFCLPCMLHQVEGDPVDPQTGNFWHTFTDLSIPGRGFPLELTRTYNSAAASSNGPFGYGWSFAYGMSLTFPSSTQVLVNQEEGSQVTFTQQPDGTYSAPPRVTATLIHNENGTWTLVRHRRDSFTFNSGGQLTTETDLNGYSTTLSYNEKGQLVRVTDPAGRKLTFSYSAGHIVKVVDPLKRAIHYEYDKAGDLTDVIDAAGGDTHFTYDAQHHLLSMRFPDQAPGVPGSTGAAIHNTYDEQGRITSQTDQLGRTTTFAYSGEPLGEAGGTTTITNAKGDVTLQSYQYGELTSETQAYGTPEAATWKFEYEQSTLGLAAVTDPDGHTTHYTYDSEGNVLSSEDALGRKTVNTYDALNDLLTSTDAMGVTTTMTYDAHGNLLSRSRPLTGTSQTETATYTHGDSAEPGDVTAMTDPDGEVWRYSYDKYGDRTSVTDPLGDETSYTYNADGWKLREVSPRGNASSKPAEYTTTYKYDELDQLTSTVDPLGHTTTEEYDPDQNLIASRDPDGNTTRYSYDAADEQTAIQRADGSTTQTTYWPDGSVKEQIDAAGHVTRYEYDALGQQISVTDPLGRTTRYTYDGAGNELTMTDPEGQVTTTTYDADNEPTSISYSDGKTPDVTGLTYNADGERTGMTDGTGKWSWSWDSLQRLTSVTEGGHGTVSYSYDLDGLPTAITYPNGKTVSRTYDAAGRLIAVKDWHENVTEFHYDNDGAVSEQIAADVVDHFSYNNAEEMVGIADKRGETSLFAAQYTRDGDGQLTSDSSAAPAQDSYAYTALNQLCYAGSSSGEPCTTPPSGASTYRYDESDNLTQDGQTSQAFDAADELCWSSSSATSASGCSSPPAGATRYSYDARGNRVAATPSGEAPSTLTYDQANRLVGYEAGATKASYQYNGEGLRMSKKVGKTTTGFSWDLSAELPLLLEAGKTAYIYGPEELPVEQITGSAVAWLHHDQSGSTRVITNQAGDVTGAYRYSPWGQTLSHTGTASTSLQFDGQYTDAESGFQYLRARYYDPRTGVFLTPDEDSSVTRAPYGFASDDPLVLDDPTGNKSVLSKIATVAEDTAAVTGLAGILVEGCADSDCTTDPEQLLIYAGWIADVSGSADLTAAVAACASSPSGKSCAYEIALTTKDFATRKITGPPQLALDALTELSGLSSGGSTGDEEPQCTETGNFDPRPPQQTFNAQPPHGGINPDGAGGSGLGFPIR